MYVHHIVPEREDGPDTIDNAAPLCDKCHGEVSHYNPKQPLGTSYSREEVKRLRDRLWADIEANPAMPLPLAPISVSPTRIEGPRSRAERLDYEININNNSDLVLFEVMLAVGLADFERGGFALDWGMVAPASGPEIKVGRSTWHSGMLRLHFTVEETGEPFELILLRRLDPHTVYRIPLTVRSESDDQPAVSGGSGVVTVIDISTQPAPTMTSPSEIDPGWTDYLVRIQVFGKRLRFGISTPG